MKMRLALAGAFAVVVTHPAFAQCTAFVLPSAVRVYLDASAKTAYPGIRSRPMLAIPLAHAHWNTERFIRLDTDLSVSEAACYPDVFETAKNGILHVMVERETSKWQTFWVHESDLGAFHYDWPGHLTEQNRYENLRRIREAFSAAVSTPTPAPAAPTPTPHP